jgi:protein phosphatase-4 regulatory subunit 3
MIKENISRDNLLNSACLDFFEYFRVQGSLAMVTHLVENYRDKLVSLSSIDTFKDLVAKYDNRKSWTVPGKKSSSPGPAQEVGEVSTAKYWQGLKDLDAAEEEYFNTSEDELAAPVKESANGPSRPTKPLVDYDSDEMDSEDDRLEEMVKFGDFSDTIQVALDGADKSNDSEPKVDAVRPPERLSEKRRREDEEDDELMKLSQSSKRRSSTSSTESGASLRSNGKRKFAAAAKDAISSATKKISISLGSSLKQTEGRNVHAEK